MFPFDVPFPSRRSVKTSFPFRPQKNGNSIFPLLFPAFPKVFLGAPKIQFVRKTFRKLFFHCVISGVDVFTCNANATDGKVLSVGFFLGCFSNIAGEKFVYYLSRNIKLHCIFYDRQVN